MRRNTTALNSMHRGSSASAHEHSQRSDFGKASTDDQVYRDREARVKVHFNVSIPSIYNILTGQEKYNLTSGTKLNIMITGQEQYISTIGNNMVQVTAQQDQPLLRAFLSTNGGVTTRTAAVVRRHEGKKPDDNRLGIRSRRRKTPSDQHHHPSGAAVQGTGQDLTGDLVHYGDSTRPS